MLSETGHSGGLKCTVAARMSNTVMLVPTREKILFRDVKTMDDKLIHISNNYEQNYPLAD